MPNKDSNEQCLFGGGFNWIPQWSGGDPVWGGVFADENNPPPEKTFLPAAYQTNEATPAYGLGGFGGGGAIPTFLPFYAQCVPGFEETTLGCEQCQVGHFAANVGVNPTGMEACEPSAPGYYVEKRGAHKQELCSQGKFSSSAKATSCEDCAVGSYQPEQASVGCNLCLAGSVQPALGQAMCNVCAIGEYMPFRGQTKCTKCSDIFPDSTTEEEGSQSFHSCVCRDGYYRSKRGCKEFEETDPNDSSRKVKYTKCPCVACPEGFECPLGSDARYIGVERESESESDDPAGGRQLSTSTLGGMQVMRRRHLQAAGAGVALDEKNKRGRPCVR